MLKRLFLKKSKEILNEVEAAENIIKECTNKIEKFYDDNIFNLIREEMIRLIARSNFLSADIRMSAIYNNGDYSEKNTELQKVMKEINECLNEIDSICKDKK